MAKPTIVTRATKGSALTWTEGDANITNLKDATIAIKAGSAGTSVVSDLNGEITFVAGTNVTLTGDNTAKTVTINAAGGSGITDVVQDTTPQLGGSLDVNGNAIVSASNGNIRLEPNGSGNIALTPTTGKITLGALDFPTGMGSNGQVLTTNGSSAMTWTTVSGGATNLDGLSDVVITAAATNDVLVYNGTDWVDTAANTLTVSAASTATTATNITVTQVSTSATYYPLMATTNGTGDKAPVLGTNFTMNPASGALTAVSLTTSGSITPNSTGGPNINFGTSTLTANAWTTLGISLRQQARNYTDASSTGTVAVSAINGFGISTLNSTNAITVTEASTFYIQPPAATGNTTITTAYGLISTGRIKASDFVGTVGATTASTGSFTTLSATGAITSTVATGTAPFTVTSTTEVANLKAAAAGAVSSTGAYATAGTNYIPFVGTNTTTNQALRTSAGLTIDPSSGVTSVWGIVSTGAFQRNSGRSSGTLGNGSGFSIGAATWADTTTAAGTVATEYISYFNTPTITHANAVTVTEAATLALADPVASTNTTFTNKYSLVAAGRIKASDFTGTVGATTASTGVFTTLTTNAQGELRLSDSDSSNYVGFKSPATVSANKVWTLPSVDGTSGQVLSTNGSATLSWVTAGGSGNGIIVVNNGQETITFSTSSPFEQVQSWTLTSAGGVSGVSVSTNSFILPAGTYKVEGPNLFSSAASAPDYELYNITDSSQVMYVTNQSITLSGVAKLYIPAWVQTFTIAASKTFKLRAVSSNSGAWRMGYTVGGKVTLTITKLA